MSMDVRPAAVAGLFYPESTGILARDVSRMLGATVEENSRKPKALIVPHAGYLYSGPVAASAYALLGSARETVKRVVLLGPTHRVAVDGLALPTCRAFATPLGDVPIDDQAISGIRDLPQIVFSDMAHAEEHSLEVQLPFLQTLLDDFSLLPLAVGMVTPAMVAEVLERLWGGDETLIVVSSDLSHYLPYDEARRIDARTARDILELRTSIDHQQACGATPMNGLLLAARRHGLQARLVEQRNSGDTAGDRQRVVGYGAFAFYDEAHHDH